MNYYKNILIVVRYPLGGIRTYMRYMFRHFPPNYKLTLLAASTQENDAISRDIKEYGAKLLLIECDSIYKFAINIHKEIRKNKYDLILSQGFISATSVYFANQFIRLPHILTIHGILEPRFFVGRFAGCRRLLIYKVLKNVTVLYGVSNDILSHVYDHFPRLEESGPRAIVIPNGIEPSDFVVSNSSSINLRETFDIDNFTFLFGFFGRFMPQKGFDLIIQAVNALKRDGYLIPFKIVAVGSGDFIRELQQNIYALGLDDSFIFLPFQPHVYQLYPQLDAILMPSRWEASGLLGMEALCMGTPLVASDCIGLRETVAGTPAMVFRSEVLNELVTIMKECLKNNRAEEFKSFIPQARERFNVVSSARELVCLIEDVITKRHYE